MAKREYLKNYQPNDKGAYDYVGLSWLWPSAEERTGFLRFAATQSILAALCLLAAGFVPAPGSFGAFYLVLPYGVAVVALALAVYGLIRVSREGERIRDHIYKGSLKSLALELLVSGMSAALSAACAAVHGLFVDRSQALYTLLFVLFMAGSAACTLSLAAHVKKLKLSADA